MNRRKSEEMSKKLLRHFAVIKIINREMGKEPPRKLLRRLASFAVKQ
jgi:hypothetical protein